MTNTFNPLRSSSKSWGPNQPLVAVHQRLSTTVAVVAMIAASMGLLLDGVYGSDEATVQMLRGFDAVALVVVAPGLLLAVRADRRGIALGRVIAASLLAYLGYTYVYHLLGAGITDVLLLHAPLLTTTLVALALTMRTIPAAEPEPWSRTAHWTRRIPAAVLALLCVSLGAMWTYACVAYAVNGTFPSGSSLVESPAVTHLGIVLDLTVLVPLYGAAAVLLWSRAVWGFVLAAVALVAGILHQVSYLVALVFQYTAEVPGSVAMDPVEPLILLLYGVATALLFRSEHTISAACRHDLSAPDTDGDEDATALP